MPGLAGGVPVSWAMARAVEQSRQRPTDSFRVAFCCSPLRWRLPGCPRPLFTVCVRTASGWVRLMVFPAGATRAAGLIGKSGALGVMASMLS